MTGKIPIPRYYEIFDYLQKELRYNQYLPGKRLPSEKELGETFGVSRITVRSALAEMERRGLVTRQRGRGTYVAGGYPGAEFPKFTGLVDNLFMIGRGAVVKEASVDCVAASPAIKKALRLDDSTPSVTRIQRVLLLHGKPYAFHQNFYPQSVGKRIHRRDMFKFPLLEILEQKLHIPVLEVAQVVEADVASTEVAARLDIPFGFPLLYVERTLLTKGKIPVGFTRAYYRGDAYRLSVTLVRKDSARENGWTASE